eukprot:XP_025015693.1 RHOMBOID-like protein 1 [Ricinus communis]
MEEKDHRPPSSQTSQVQIRMNGYNAVHPVEIDTPPQLPSSTQSPLVYTQVKHHSKKWKPWIIPSFVIANIVMFVITMYVNNCPKNSVSCVASFLGRFSFQPFKENPLLGPSSNTFATDKILLYHIFLMINFPVKIGLLYVISGFGGSLMSSLFIQTNISVGASGALFGLLGAMLSELITNWTIYTNKVAAFVTLLIIIAINLAVGILPHVDNFAHIGGFLSGFLLGFVFLIRPQFGWVSQRYVPPGYSPASVKPKFKAYQRILWIISLIVVVAGLTLGLVLLLRGVDANDHCSWCHYLSCVPTSRWSCNTEPASCLSSQMGSQLNVTCTTNGKSSVYRLPDATNSQIEGLCTQLCR